MPPSPPILRVVAAFAVTALAAVPFADASGPAGAAKKRVHVKRPKAGQYIGHTRQGKELTLYVKGRTVRLAIAELKCGLPTARVAVRRVKLHRTRRGYAFALHGRRTVTYNDHYPAQRSRVDISGRFTRKGARPRGRVRIKSKRCGARGPVRWSARRVKRTVKTPASGQYDGKTEQGRTLTLYISGTSIQLAAFGFTCGNGEGRTVLNSVPMRRTRRGYAFGIKANGNVTYSDGHPDENAEVDLFGRFNPAATRARGHIRAKSAHCGGTGKVSFSVKRARRR